MSSATPCQMIIQNILIVFISYLDNMKFYKPFMLYKTPSTCDWPQINCNRSAGHTLHYYGHDKVFDKNLKLRVLYHYRHLVCGWQILNILSYLLIDSFKILNSVCL